AVARPTKHSPAGPLRGQPHTGPGPSPLDTHRVVANSSSAGKKLFVACAMMLVEIRPVIIRAEPIANPPKNNTGVRHNSWWISANTNAVNIRIVHRGIR